MPGKLEEKKKKRRETIVEETIRQIRELGYDAVTMEGIAKSCSITKRTLYKYYPVKEAILADFIQMTFHSREKERLQALSAITSFREQVHYYLSILMQGVLREPVIFEKYIIYVMKKLVSYHEKNQEESGVADPLRQIIRRGMQNGDIDPAVPTGLVIDFFLFAFVELTKFYYKNPASFGWEKHLEICTNLFVQGVQRKE